MFLESNTVHQFLPSNFDISYKNGSSVILSQLYFEIWVLKTAYNAFGNSSKIQPIMLEIMQIKIMLKNWLFY